MKPICAKCEIEYRPEKNGVRVCEWASFGPYKLWQADLLKCPKCGHLLIHGFGQNAESEHFEDAFKELLKKVDFNCYEKISQLEDEELGNNGEELKDYPDENPMEEDKNGK